jgi:hypothetical protein
VADVDDRGQLMLVGALTLAVMLVTLAVLLNAAIYTGNVATRDAGPGTAEAIEYEGAATSMARHVIRSLDGGGDGSYPSLRGNFTDAVDGWSRATSAHSAVGLADASLEKVATERGSRIAQTADRNFTDTGGNATWTVANDTRVRAFRMNVTQNSLAPFPASPITNGSFRVTLDDGTDEWAVYLHQGGPDLDGVSVTVVDPDGNEVDDGCTVAPGTDDRAVIDLTGATVAGQSCPEMRFFGNLSGEYTVRYVDAENGSGTEQVFGTYSVVVDRPLDNLSTGADTTGSTEPAATRTLYSADLRVTYRSADVYYRSEFRVAPGEPDA